MNDRSEPEGRAKAEGEEPEEFVYEMKSVREAANLLQLSESTIWRYAAQDILPAYKVGKKRVMFRRSDLEALRRRTRRRKEPVAAREALRLIPISESATTMAEAIARMRELQAEILARRGGVPLSDSVDDINAARQERTADL